jgi:hypothetical protein
MFYTQNFWAVKVTDKQSPRLKFYSKVNYEGEAMSRSNRTKNRLAKIRKTHENAILYKGSYQSEAISKLSGFKAGITNGSSNSKNDRPLGHSFGGAVTAVYRHKIKTDKKAQY